jgi:hypothetical protein
MRGIILERTAGQPARSIGSATTALRQKITFGKKAPSRRPQPAALLQGQSSIISLALLFLQPWPRAQSRLADHLNDNVLGVSGRF